MIITPLIALGDESPEMTEYLLKCKEAVDSDNPDVRPYLTTICPECDEIPEDDEHYMIGDKVLIGCEGYFVINPNVIGINSPNWCDWLD